MALTHFLQKLRNHQSLTVDESSAAFDAIFSGHIPPVHIEEFLLRLHKRGESIEEIQGAVQSMRAHAITINAPANAVDIVGTGGDARGTLNISTATALVVAACGVPVAKHGNRAATSKSGSSDVLAALGVNLEPPLAIIEKCLAEANLCFLFAPRHHPVMRHVADIRRKMGVRTIFNLLGPLTNPANVKQHLIGVYDKKWLRPMAEVLKLLGSHAAWLTHGRDGLDEITITEPTDVVALDAGIIHDFLMSPVEAGLAASPLDKLQGGDAAYNAEAIQRLLDGEHSAYRDIVVLNAAAALIVVGKAADLRKGAVIAADALSTGAARATLNQIVALTRRSA